MKPNMALLNLKTFQRHTKSLNRIHSDVEKLFVALEDEWLDLYKKQQAGKNDKPDWFDEIEWEMGKQVIVSFQFDVFHECPTMVLTIEVTPGCYEPILVKIDEEIINLYQNSICNL